MSILQLPEPARAIVSDAILNWDFAEPVCQTPKLSIETRHFGSARISRLSGTGCRASRTNRHHDRDGGDFLGIICTLAGQERLEWGDQQARIVADDVVVWRNVGDLRFLVDDFTSKLIMLLPYAEVQQTVQAALADTHLILSGKSAMGKLVSSFLKSLATSFGTLDDVSGRTAAEMAVQLVASAIAHEQRGSVQRTRTTLYERIVAHIDRNLDDRELDPTRLAAAHGISLRYLHLLFAQNGQTVSSFIRDRRLELCRRQIETGSNRLSMAELAFKWGFSDVPHFSRSFKRRFGLSPSAWQSCHLGPAGAAGQVIHKRP